MKPRLLDLYCGAGGCSTGYHQAGYQVTGVDNNPAVLRNYPYDAIRADALDILQEPRIWEKYDLIHASPPCQTYSITRHTHSNPHPDLLATTLDLLNNTRKPWIVENVEHAPLNPALTLCGSMFGLTTLDTDGTPVTLRRHRLFAATHPLRAPAACTCLRTHRLNRANLRPTRQADKIGGVYGGGSNNNNYAKNVRRGGYTPAKPIWEKLMGIDWMTRDQLTQAIPPAYTHWLGTLMLDHLHNQDESRTA